MLKRNAKIFNKSWLKTDADTIDKVVALLKPEQKIQFDKQRAEWRAERKTRREKAEERAEAPAAGAPSAKPVK